MKGKLAKKKHAPIAQRIIVTGRLKDLLHSLLRLLIVLLFLKRVMMASFNRMAHFSPEGPALKCLKRRKKIGGCAEKTTLGCLIFGCKLLFEDEWLP
jgi:hypothetical protein